MSAPTLEKILQAVNEKYGTSFEGWSQLPTAYEVGDTVPNWSAYEKIEITRFKWNTGTDFVVGFASENLVMISVNQFAALVNSTGVIGFNQRRIIQTDIDKINTALGTEYTEVTYESFGYVSGDTIPNFENYLEIE